MLRLQLQIRLMLDYQCVLTAAWAASVQGGVEAMAAVIVAEYMSNLLL